MNTLRDARIQRDLNNVSSQVQQLVSTLGEQGAESLQGLRERLKSAAADLSSSARDKFSTINTAVTDNTRAAAKVTDTYVRDNPWRAIGIGAAAGLIVGFLISRR